VGFDFFVGASRGRVALRGGHGNAASEEKNASACELAHRAAPIIARSSARRAKARSRSRDLPAIAG
jgi:Na+/glutamate symporter